MIRKFFKFYSILKIKKTGGLDGINSSVLNIVLKVQAYLILSVVYLMNLS